MYDCLFSCRIQSETTSRPQRSAALTTMSAIHIANNLPPLKQAFQRPPSAHKSTPQGSTHTATPPKKVANATSIRKNANSSSGTAAAKGVHSSKSTTTVPQKGTSLPSPTFKSISPKKTSPTMSVSKEVTPLSEVKLQPAITLPKKVVTPPPPLSQLMEEPQMNPPPKKSPLLSPSLKSAHKSPKMDDGSGEKGKKGGRYITIPSIEYPVSHLSHLDKGV